MKFIWRLKSTCKKGGRAAIAISRQATFSSFSGPSNLQNFLLRCAPDVLAFLFMFQIIFMAFAQFANLIFGTKLEYFADVMHSA